MRSRRVYAIPSLDGTTLPILQPRLCRLHLSRFPGALVRGVRLDHRHVDAEGRAELAGLRSHQVVVLSRSRRFPRAAADPALYPARRRHRRSPRPPAAAHRLAVRPDGDGVHARGAGLPGRVHVAHILALSFTAGLAQAFGGPAYQSLMPSLVQKKDLPNAIALNSIQFNLARVFGPLLAGVDAGGLRHGDVLRSQRPLVSVVIVALLSLSVTHIPPIDRKPMLHELQGRLHATYARAGHHRADRPGVADDVSRAAAVDVPADFRARHLSRRRRPLQPDDGVLGAGAVIGALVVAWLGRFKHMGRTLLIVQVVFGGLICCVRPVAHLLAQRPAALPGGAHAADGVLDDRVAGAADRPRSPARPRHEHLHGGVPRRHAARQPRRPAMRPTYVGVPIVLAINGGLVSLVAIYFFVKSQGFGSFRVPRFKRTF